MVLMSVGDHKTLYLIDIVHQISHVRDNQVNTQHIITWESKAAVHHDNGVIILDGSHVHSDLLQTSQRDDLDFTVIFFDNFVHVQTSVIVPFL